MDKTTNLLTARELARYYSIPIWNKTECTEYFSLTPDELKQFRQYEIASSLYYAVVLAIFKQYHIVITLDETDVSQYLQHLNKRYYNGALNLAQLIFPQSRKTKQRIENKILAHFDYRRCRTQILSEVEQALQKVAPRYPKQRGLCKALIDYCQYQKILLPSYSTLEKLVRSVWLEEQQRLVKAYKRYTTLSQRKQIQSLLDGGEQFRLITELQREMKGFTTEEIDNLLEQQTTLWPIFSTATSVLPRLKLPQNTIHYFATLVHYYKGNQLANLDPDKVATYLLCYAFSRFQSLNDISLEALKKRTMNYYNNSKRDAALHAGSQLATIKKARQAVSQMLLAIKHSRKKDTIAKATLFKYVPESQLELTAQLLVSDELDPEWAFWQEVDHQSKSIALNLRKIFIALDLEVTNHEPLKCAIDLLKTTLTQNKPISELPKIILDWLPETISPHLLVNGHCLQGRFEFWIYYQIAQHIKSNKLTLRYTSKYKKLEDDLSPKPTWNKNKKKIIQTLPYSGIKTKPSVFLEGLMHKNQMLFNKINYAINNGKNDHVLIDKTQAPVWKLKPLEENQPPVDSFFSAVPKRSIVWVMQLVNSLLHFTDLFQSIVPRGAKHEQSPDYIIACILGNALRIGNDTLGSISDLNRHSLLSVEQSCIRMETLNAALEHLHQHTMALPIFKQWNIDGLAHGSLDGMKLQSQRKHHKAQASPKYFNMGVGLSSYSLVLNHFSLAGKLIGANEYEGHFAFELNQFQQTNTSLLERLSTDKHGMNSINFLLFHLVDTEFAPRIPKPHHETLWGFKENKHSVEDLIRSQRNMNSSLWLDEWDNVQHVVSSILTGDANASIIVRKLASPSYHSKTKLAMSQCSQVLKTNFLLRCIDDVKFRHAIERALNRGEAFNRLYRAITLLNKGQLRGRTEIEMMVWDACTRLLAGIIQYYNALILNRLYEKATDEKTREYILRLTPTAWSHINMLGHYQFFGNPIQDIQRWLDKIRVEELIDFG